MRVAHITFHDRQDGAARVARTLLDSLTAQGHEAVLFAHHKTNEDSRIISLPLPQTPWQRDLLEKQNRQGLNQLYSTALLQVLQHPAFQAADVLHLHAINGNYFSFLLFPFLTALKPTVWTLYDSLAFTGGCYNADACDLWRDMGCSGCPLDAGQSTQTENFSLGYSKREMLQMLKTSLYRLSNFTVVSPSQERKEQAMHSILEGHDVRLIYHGVDTNVFKPGERAILRARLGLPPTAKIVLFPAPGGFGNSARGGQFLRQALPKLSKQIPDLLLVTVGGGPQNAAADVPVRHVELPFLADPAQLAAYYGAADVVAAPAIFNTPGLTPLEAMACGTPVVAFDSGGMNEIIAHQQTGYLAKLRDSDDLAAGLAALLSDEQRRQLTGQAARLAVLQRFTAQRMSQEYLTLYQEMAAAKAPAKPHQAPSSQPVTPQKPAVQPAVKTPVNLADLESRFQIPATVEQARQTGWKQVIQEFHRRYESFDKQKSADRALFTDLYFDYCLRALDPVAQSPLLWELAGQWFLARRLPPRCCGFASRCAANCTRISAAYRLRP